jgi:hypothetical protein
MHEGRYVDFTVAIILVLVSNPGPFMFIVTDIDLSQVILGDLCLLTQVLSLAKQSWASYVF